MAGLASFGMVDRIGPSGPFQKQHGRKQIHGGDDDWRQAQVQRCAHHPEGMLRVHTKQPFVHCAWLGSVEIWGLSFLAGLLAPLVGFGLSSSFPAFVPNLDPVLPWALTPASALLFIFHGFHSVPQSLSFRVTA